MIAICDNDGEIARLVEQYQCGDVVAPGNPDALVNLVLRLSTDSTKRDEMGRRARVISPVARPWNASVTCSNVSGNRPSLRRVLINRGWLAVGQFPPIAKLPGLLDLLGSLQKPRSRSRLWTVVGLSSESESAVPLAPQTRCGRLWGKSRPRKQLTWSGTCRGTR